MLCSPEIVGWGPVDRWSELNPFRTAVPFGGQPLNFQVVWPRNGTAVLEGSRFIRRRRYPWRAEGGGGYRCYAETHKRRSQHDVLNCQELVIQIGSKTFRDRWMRCCGGGSDNVVWIECFSVRYRTTKVSAGTMFR